MKAKRSDTGNKQNQQRSESNRVLKSQDQTKPNKQPSEGREQVSPFELFPTNGQVCLSLADLRRVVRNEMEIVERQRQLSGSHTNLQAGFRDLKMQVAQVKHLLNNKSGDSKGLQTYVNSRLQHFSTESQHRHESLKNMLGQLEKKSNERFSGLQIEIQGIEARLSRQSRSAHKQTAEHSRLSMLETSIEELFEKLKSPVCLTGDNSLSHSSAIPASDAEKEMRTIKNQFKMAVASINLQLSSMEEDIDCLSKDLKKKINVNDLSETIEQLRDGIKQQGFGMQTTNQAIDEIRKEHDEIALRIFKAEESLVIVEGNTEGKLLAMRKTVEEYMQSLTDSFETKIGRIVNSYNLNFEEIDVNCQELRTMLSEVLNINSLLSSRLLKIVTHKIDSTAFQSTIETLNEQISEELFVNSRRLRQIGEKEFEVEHELKSLKEILEGLRTDYQRNYNKLKLDDDRASFCGSGSKVKANCENIGDGIRSPKQVEQLFKKPEGMYDCYSSMERRTMGKQRSNLSRSIREPAYQRLSDELSHLE